MANCFIDGAEAPHLSASECATVIAQMASLKGITSLSEVSIIGIDLAKRVRQLRGGSANGTGIFSKGAA